MDGVLFHLRKSAGQGLRLTMGSYKFLDNKLNLDLVKSLITIKL